MMAPSEDESTILTGHRQEHSMDETPCPHDCSGSSSSRVATTSPSLPPLISHDALVHFSQCGRWVRWGGEAMKDKTGRVGGRGGHVFEHSHN